MLNRRSFIKSSIFAAGAVSLGVTEVTYAAAGDSCRWALLSDIHLPADKTEVHRGYCIAENMDALIPGVVDFKPEGIAITGDLARLKGLAEDYVVVKEYVDQLSQTAPVFMALGNHDNLKNFNAAFPATSGEKMPVKGKHVTVVNSGPMRFIFLDSLLTTHYVGGLLGKAQRTWLDTYLKGADKRPTVLFQHHTFGEGDVALHDDLRLFNIVLPQRHVKAVVFGHSHAYRFTKQDDLDLINIPSTAYTFQKTLPIGWVEATFNAAGVELKLNAIGGNKSDNGKVTKIEWRS